MPQKLFPVNIRVSFFVFQSLILYYVSTEKCNEIFSEQYFYSHVSISPFDLYLTLILVDIFVHISFYILRKIVHRITNGAVCCKLSILFGICL
jgi:hypothetical protein